MSRSSLVTESDVEVKSRNERKRGAAQEDLYDDDEFQESVRNILSCSDTEGSYCTDSCPENDNGVEDVQNDTEVQLIIDALERSSEKANIKTCNRTFTEDKLRDIERNNSILMSRILSNGRRPSQYGITSGVGNVSSSTINRKKRQKEIDQHNLILLRRIQSVKPFGLSHRKN